VKIPDFLFTILPSDLGASYENTITQPSAIFPN
jgi:hypothetical protein